MEMFPIPILKESIPSSEVDEKALFQDILRQYDKLCLKVTREEAYTSFFTDDPMAGIDWSSLERTIATHVNNYISIVNYDCNIQESRVHAWWNIYHRGISHNWHHHPRALLSGTYYVKRPADSASIQFKSPINGLIDSWAADFGIDTKWAQNANISPNTGDLMLWPSWLEHQVPAINTRDVQRCSISFNIQLRRI